jgi:hypothetical protein
MDLSTRSFSSLALVLGLLFTTGCAPAFTPNAQSGELAKDLQDGFSCHDVRSKVFDAYYRAYENPQANLLNEASLDSEKVSPALKATVQSVHALIAGATTRLSAAQVSASPDETRDPLLQLIRLEMRSEVDPELVKINSQLDHELASAHSVAVSEGVPCKTPGTPGGPTTTATPQPSRLPASVAAARLTMATAYQSCQSLTLPPLTSAVENVQGITKGAKIDVGYGREYTDLALLKKTDYYLHGQTYPQGCINQDKKPLVYDYSGVPVIKSSSLLSLFENSGGGSALGIDCSAFISTSVAVAGQRYKEGMTNKPAYTRFASRDFIDPKKSGWTCFAPVSVNADSTLAAGDIAAVIGHIVMVDSVGADPFGLQKIRSASQCSAINYRDFDFTIIQSAATKNGIGINRFVARDYLKEEGRLVALFTEYAKSACLSKFDGQVRSVTSSIHGLIRHKNTSACTAPPIELVGQSCVQSCVQ